MIYLSKKVIILGHRMDVLIFGVLRYCVAQRLLCYLNLEYLFNDALTYVLAGSITPCSGGIALHCI